MHITQTNTDTVASVTLQNLFLRAAMKLFLDTAILVRSDSPGTHPKDWAQILTASLTPRQHWMALGCTRGHTPTGQQHLQRQPPAGLHSQLRGAFGSRKHAAPAALLSPRSAGL